MDTKQAELLVCVTCRGPGDCPSPAADAAADATRDGRRLHDALAAMALPDGVRLRAVSCLQNCEGGCTVALRGPGRWSYVYGGLATDDTAMLVDGARRYLATADGLIPWRERPLHFRRNCVARIPPPDFPDPLQEQDP